MAQVYRAPHDRKDLDLDLVSIANIIHEKDIVILCRLLFSVYLKK
jgi:hypothetical protein